MKWLDAIMDSMDMSLSKLQEMVKDREAWHAAVHRIAKSWTRLSDFHFFFSSEVHISPISLGLVKVFYWWTDLDPRVFQHKIRRSFFFR